MVTYVNSDGTVSNRRSIWRVIEDTIAGLIGAIMLFFSAIFNPPSLQNQQNGGGSTFASRNGGRSHRGSSTGRGSNVRGCRDLGSANAPMGGG